jgi:hypothetical protein
VAAITPTSNRLRRPRKDTRRDDHAFGLFLIEKKTEEGHWSVRSTRRTVRAAQDCAWDVLTCEGGEVRVRQGRHIIAEGSARTPTAR